MMSGTAKLKQHLRKRAVCPVTPLHSCMRDGRGASLSLKERRPSAQPVCSQPPWQPQIPRVQEMPQLLGR